MRSVSGSFFCSEAMAAALRERAALDVTGPTLRENIAKTRTAVQQLRGMLQTADIAARTLRVGQALRGKASDLAARRAASGQAKPTG